jgi:uncharacterized protein (TIGR02145 family)
MIRVMLFLLIILSSFPSIHCQISDTQKTGTFIDYRDGHEYKWVKIGEQVWMAENLNYMSREGSVCYENELPNCHSYGRLYKYKTAQQVCPKGWHLPNENEWAILLVNCGMERKSALKKNWQGINEGGLLKEKGNNHWNLPNIGASDKYGFTALPGGVYNGGKKEYSGIGDYAYIWEYKPNKELWDGGRALSSDKTQVLHLDALSNKAYLSVRCIKDSL